MLTEQITWPNMHYYSSNNGARDASGWLRGWLAHWQHQSCFGPISVCLCKTSQLCLSVVYVQHLQGHANICMSQYKAC